MLVVPRTGAATMVIPALEAPRVREIPGAFDLLPWGETQDPTAIVARLAAGSSRIAVGDQMWARFLVELLAQVPGAEYTPSGRGGRPVAHVEGCGRDRRARRSRRRRRPHRRGAAARRDPAGRSNRSRGVGTPESPDHRGRPRQGELRHRGRGRERGQPAPPRRIPGDPRERDRPVRLRRHDGRLLLRHHPLCLHRRTIRRGGRGVRRAPRGATGRSRRRGGRHAVRGVDRATRAVIDEAGYGEYFIHRTGHGIGMEEHEDPYIVEGNTLPLEAGHAYSVEPGIYVPGRWGMRLEDIVVATAEWPGRTQQLRPRPRRRRRLTRQRSDTEPRALSASATTHEVGVVADT